MHILIRPIHRKTPRLQRRILCFRVILIAIATEKGDRCSGCRGFHRGRGAGAQMDQPTSEERDLPRYNEKYEHEDEEHRYHGALCDARFLVAAFLPPVS
jgi:hypothetical protein